MKSPVVAQFRSKIICFLLAVFLITPNSNAINPDISKYLTNLSSKVNPEPLDDLYPEMVISGNTIHVVWIEYKYGVDKLLYYCRSTDLGKTWEAPKLISKLKDSDYTLQPQSRKLAVDGSTVHIAFCDYDYFDSGTGRIFYFRSSNGGSSFDPVKELATTGPGANRIYGAHIKAANGKVAVAYLGTGLKNGLHMLFSADGGTAFGDKLITGEPNGLSDLWFEGGQIIVVSEYAYYYYGLNLGKVYVSVSNDDAETFVTNKISITYNESATSVRERCRCFNDVHYAPKIARSGNNIHVVFSGYNENGVWTTLYARSVDNGTTFEKARDINNGVFTGSMQSGQETLAAKNGHVYLAFLSTTGKVFFLQSADNGNTFPPAWSILPDGYANVEAVWWPALITDPNDSSGATVYLTGNCMVSLRSSNGGISFTQSMLGTPFLNSNISNCMADMAVDSQGGKHWIAEAKWRGGSDRDIFYRSIGTQPDPGTINKSYSVETVYAGRQELTIVASSPSLDLDSAMTAEAWVKLDPSTQSEINVLAKVNGSDNYDYVPNGYQMGFRKNGTKFCINSGLETDRGDFVNWGDCSINDTLWHHVAFTYDANGGLGNFRTFVDGLLSAEQTVIGRIITGNGLLMIGSRAAYSGTTKYQLDNIRLWNRALTQEELLANQVKKLTGQESGLVMFLNFDDTFKDISGNGNDAIPLYLGNLTISDFNPPVPGFDLYQNMSQISLTNKTRNGTSWLWSFGDGSVSDKGNPVYTYPRPGEYTVILGAMNDNSKTAAIKRVSIEGIDHIDPVQAGNVGYSRITVFGGGLTVEGTTFLLRKTGNQEIAGEQLFAPAQGVLSAQFRLEKVALGKWDVVVAKGSSEQVLAESFEVVAGEEADPWVSISGRGAIIFNMWQTYTINFGNNGNVDAYGVPIWLAVTDDSKLEVEFIDFVMETPTRVAELGLEKEIKDLGPYFLTESVFGESMKARVYPIMIPVIPGKSSSGLHIRVRTSGSIKMKIWNNQPLLGYVAGYEGNDLKNGESGAAGQISIRTPLCVFGVLAEAALDVGTAWAAPEVDCVMGAAKFGFQLGLIPPWNKKFNVKNTAWNFLVTGLDCGLSLSGIEGAYKSIGVLFANSWDYYENLKSCYLLGFADNTMNILINAVFSFDPNEMAGPAGYGENHWIQKNSSIPYTVFFENKSSATAPAHIVTVTDTLDLNIFDLKDFGFGSFGFGDTTLMPEGDKLKAFSKDIDLRPGMNLIARVSGRVDTLTGIIRWEFLSLNPSTLELEEDPYVGFLPPNNANHAGEGFVSFSAGLKPLPGTSSVLKNKASIVFDANPPIVTNEFVNTLDVDKPQSQVLPLGDTNVSRFPVSWTGTDAGSGIAGYSIYVLQNDTAFRAWKINTPLLTEEFTGEVGSAYKFYSIATDHVSLTEDTPEGYDASTHIILSVDELEHPADELRVFPNPVSDRLTVTLENAAPGMYLVELMGVSGQVCYSAVHDGLVLSKGVVIGIDGISTGQYLLRMIYGNKTVSRKVLIK